MLENYGDVLSINELCEILRIGKNSAYKMVNSGQVASMVIAGKHKILKRSVVEFIEACFKSAEVA